jgi:hypothetical protein
VYKYILMAEASGECGENFFVPLRLKSQPMENEKLEEREVVENNFAPPPSRERERERQKGIRTSLLTIFCSSHYCFAVAFNSIKESLERAGERIACLKDDAARSEKSGVEITFMRNVLCFVCLNGSALTLHEESDAGE